MKTSTMEKTSTAEELKKTSELRFKRILVPIDFSREGQSALEYTEALALASGALIYLIHVVETLGSADEFEGILLETNKEELRCTERLRALQSSLPESLESLIVVKTGVPWEEIVAAAEELDCDLIVMSTHGRTGLMHALIGSTAERVVRHSTRPVLIKPSRQTKH